MNSEANQANKPSMTWVFIEVTGVIIAYLAILAALAYPLLTAVPWGN